MANTYRSSWHGEDGLSEVIGFVLILGLIVVVSSLYLTYGVPAQGRENEILHMNEIKDQFVSYKLSMDSLFNNNKVGTTVSNSFTLGTSGGYTQGSFSIIPFMSPVNSGGTFAINQRTVEPETLKITSQSLILNDSVKYKVDLPAQVNYTPNHVYVNISNIQPVDLTTTRFYGITVNGSGWLAIINLTPRTEYYQYYTVTPSPPTCTSPSIHLISGECLVPHDDYKYNRTDITVSILKGNVTTMQDYTIYRNVSSNVVYSIDLMNDAYGLSPAIRYPDYISITVDNPQSSGIRAAGNITYDFSEMNPYTVSAISLGSIEYRAQNNYWIAQNYYYQMGGVFLEQMDGNVTYKLPPEITFAYDNQSDPAKKIVTVNINALTIDPNNIGALGGNSPIQIKSTLANITTMPFVAGTANTKWIWIGVNTTSNPSRQMWNNYFGYTATVAGIPHFTQGTIGTETYILINGYDESNNLFDINVIASNATYTTTVHGVGGIVQ